MQAEEIAIHAPRRFQMKDSNRNQYGFLSLVFAVIAIFGLNANNVYATEAETSEGFCDCSTTGDVICHIPQKNQQNMHTIQVGNQAINAHLAHGDMMGVCPSEEYVADEEHNNNNNTSLEQACVCSDGSAGTRYHASPSSTDHSQRSISGQ
jgi:hypothetical protein